MISYPLRIVPNIGNITPAQVPTDAIRARQKQSQQHKCLCAQAERWGAIGTMPTSTTDLKSKIQDDIPEVNVQNHLKVLGVFFHLLESVPKGHATDEQSLDEFFQRATYRLQLWVERILKIGDEEQQPLQEHELPPLDVALALHSLMLSPHRYFEDSELRFRQLKRVKEYPLDMMVSLVKRGSTQIILSTIHDR